MQWWGFSQVALCTWWPYNKWRLYPLVLTFLANLPTFTLCLVVSSLLSAASLFPPLLSLLTRVTTVTFPSLFYYYFSFGMVVIKGIGSDEERSSSSLEVLLGKSPLWHSQWERSPKVTSAPQISHRLMTHVFPLVRAVLDVFSNRVSVLVRHEIVKLLLRHLGLRGIPYRFHWDKSHVWVMSWISIL